MKTPPMVAVSKMSADTFFATLMGALKHDPPHVHDQDMVARMKRIGLQSGKSLQFGALPALVQQALKDGMTDGANALSRRNAALARDTKNGWSITTGAIGYFGGDYALRAVIALVGLGANRPEDAIYPHTETDGEGQPLSGANRYVLRFAEGRTPPVDAFWSVTLYDGRGFPVQNAINRHALGDRDKLKLDDDGSLTIFIQRQSPGADKESNWLPAPEGAFTLALRCYSPRFEIAIGEWVPPPVKKVG